MNNIWKIPAGRPEKEDLSIGTACDLCRISLDSPFKTVAIFLFRLSKSVKLFFQAADTKDERRSILYRRRRLPNEYKVNQRTCRTVIQKENVHGTIIGLVVCRPERILLALLFHCLVLPLPLLATFVSALVASAPTSHHFSHNTLTAFWRGRTNRPWLKRKDSQTS
jgi:hypothetical protein